MHVSCFQIGVFVEQLRFLNRLWYPKVLQKTSFWHPFVNVVCSFFVFIFLPLAWLINHQNPQLFVCLISQNLGSLSFKVVHLIKLAEKEHGIATQHPHDALSKVQSATLRPGDWMALADLPRC